MKKALLFIFMATLIFSAKAQDTIVKKNGDVLIAKVMEIGPTEVKYKRLDIPDGPDFIDNKSDIQLIRFSNGVTEVFKAEPVTVAATPPPVYYLVPEKSQKIEMEGSQYIYHHEKINERQLYEMLQNTKDKRILGLVDQAKQARAMQYIGFGAIPLGIASYLFFLNSTGVFTSKYSTSNSSSNTLGLNNKQLALSGLCLVGTIACPIASGIYRSNKKKYNHAAINLYNEKF